MSRHSGRADGTCVSALPFTDLGGQSAQEQPLNRREGTAVLELKGTLPQPRASCVRIELWHSEAP
jgi:hypothetical protein